MKIIILYDNTAHQEKLKADWGFACLVEAYGRTILFDTGACGGILLSNMYKLGIEPDTIDEVFISHGDWDHINGLADFLAIHPVPVCLPPSCKEQCPPQAKVLAYNEVTQLHPDIYTSGEMPPGEQALFIRQGTAVTVIAGCSHPGVAEILAAASQLGTPRALVGGLHEFNRFEILKHLHLICPTHCTQHIEEIKSLYPEQFIAGGVGTTIEIP
jgi:7,8-dihydropterin-6-yl-methyl-4-(beta-D-ribofuranosyl)aminobenzene 5'-phosphate synthase